MFLKKKNKIIITKKTFLKEIPSSFWLVLFFAFLTLGLSFIGYISKKKSLINQKHNDELTLWNDNHKAKIDQCNKNLSLEIDKHNFLIDNKIEKYNSQIKLIEQKQFTLVKKEDGWSNVIDASLYGYKDILGVKGVYIIKNATKNLYYVGQSKNMGKRMLSHFKNGESNRQEFNRDFYEGNKFLFKYFLLNSKDELDREEKNILNYTILLNKVITKQEVIFKLSCSVF